MHLEKQFGWFPFMPLEEDGTLLDVILLLGTYKLKRIPIIKDDTIVNFISQSSIIKLLAEENLPAELLDIKIIKEKSKSVAKLPLRDE